MADSKKIGATTIRWFKGDLTQLDVDAFVFYAEDNLELGSGFGNAISTRGGPSIKKELDEIGKVEACEAVVSSAGLLKAEYIIHANGPKFQEKDTENKLKLTMINALGAARDKGIKKLAFPAMGTGFYGIPRPVSAKIMHDTFKEILGDDPVIEQIDICLLENRELEAFRAELS